MFMHAFRVGLKRCAHEGAESDLKSCNSKGIDPMALTKPTWPIPLGTRGYAKA